MRRTARLDRSVKIRPGRFGHLAVAGLLVICAFTTGLQAASPTEEGGIRVRIAWGGPVQRIWQGSISVRQGTFDAPRPLGMEADEPGSIWLENRSTIKIRQQSGRLYDGLDLTVHGSVESAVLQIHLTPTDQPDQTASTEVPLRDLLADPVGRDLDNQKTRLLVRRAPGDALHIDFSRRNLVFRSGEIFSFRLTPRHLEEGKRGRRLVEISLIDSSQGKPVWESTPIGLDEVSGEIPIQVPLNVNEGVYDLVLRAIQAPSLEIPSVGPVGKMPLGLTKKLSERKVQLLVLSPKRPFPSVEPENAAALKILEEIDPANPGWWDRFAQSSQNLAGLSLPRLNPSKRRPSKGWTSGLVAQLGLTNVASADLQTFAHPALGQLVQLKPSAAEKNVSWEAYTLSVKETGRPHVLEIDYPSDQPQCLGISVMEPNAAEALVPLQLDSGVSVEEPIVKTEETGRPQMLRHRLIFWPRTKAPIVLLTNHSQTRPVVHGKIRLLAGWDHLPSGFETSHRADGRLMAGYLDRPWFARNFGAGDAVDSWSGRSLEDWHTFYEGGSRLIEYLNHVGLNGLMISAFSEGATIYPSRILQSTPRFDKGAFFDSAQDPVEKDLLEMLFQCFDRERLRLIPALEFASPLAELETALRDASPEQTQGIRLIGPDGHGWTETYYPHQRLAPYYNPLDPRVQEAMLRVIDELVENYADRHDSFAGLALQLSGYGYAHLPGPEWGLDDATVARFEKERNIRLDAGTGPDRFARRWKTIQDNHLPQWLLWRADQLARFYERIQAVVRQARPTASLYLATGKLMEGPYWRDRLHPTLKSRPPLKQALLEVGILATLYQKADAPVLIYPNRIEPIDFNDRAASHLEARRWLDVGFDLVWGESESTSALLYYPPQELRVGEFDQKNPYSSSYTALKSEIVPSGATYRAALCDNLARHDARTLFQGGNFLPMGQEEAIRDWVYTYRNLPDVRFKPVNPSICPDGTQPVTIRQAVVDQKTYLYLVNNGPVESHVSLAWTMAPEGRLESLSRSPRLTGIERLGDTVTWQITLKPYELNAVRLDAKKVVLTRAEASLPESFCRRLRNRVEELGRRPAALRAPPPWEALSNPSFEKEPLEKEPIPGWTTIEGSGTSVRLETVSADSTKQPGARAVRLRSDQAPVTLWSEPFAGPTTGRLWIYAWLKVPDAADQPALELILLGKAKGRQFTRVAELGRSSDGEPAPAIEKNWAPYSFPVTDLPLEGLTDLRVGFRLQGPGEVWVDDVQLDHLAGFHVAELRELAQMLAMAGVKQRENKVADCLRILEGYWPRYLEKNVPLATPPTHLTEAPLPPSEKQEEPQPPEPAQEPETTGFLDRVKGFLPKRFW